jgi:hypothetical protein
MVFDVFSAADTVSKADGGTFDGNVTMGGTLDVTGNQTNSGDLTVSGNLSVDGGTIKLDGNYPTATENVALGDQALDDGSLSGAYNTAIGHKALTANTSGASNTSVGRTSLVTNATGSNNTAVGMDSLANVTGSDNTAIGKDAGKQITSGQKNTIVGQYNGNQDSLDIRTSDNNLVLSDGDGNLRLWVSSNRRTFIGGMSTNLSGAVNIAGEIGASYKAISFQQTNGGSEVGSIVTNTSSTSYNTSSDYRLKENITYDFDATTRLKQLKPCRFNFKIDADNTVDGFLAHEVSSIVPEAITGEKDAMTKEVLYVDGDEIPEGKKIGDVKEASKIDPQGIDQSKLVPLLVKTIQELEARITALENAE